MTEEDETIIKAFKIIKGGILQGDWTQICDAYALLSGEVLKPPVPKKTRLEKIKEALNADIQEDESSPPEKVSKKTKSLKKPKETQEGEVVISESEITNEKFQGGKRFAKDGFSVISTEENDYERKLNKQKNKRSNLPQRLPKGDLQDKDGGEDGISVKFSQKDIPGPRRG